MEIRNNNIYFSGKLGPNLVKHLKVSEFGGNTKHTKDFEQLFHDTFIQSLDDTTIIEMNKKGTLEIFNEIFPKIKIALKFNNKNKKLTENIMSEHPINYASKEYRLFQKIIASEVKKGKSFEELTEIVTKNLTDGERREHFFDLINSAKRIKSENPDTELSELNFSIMNTKILRELLELPSIKKALGIS